jgi:hypothetical protein
MVHGLGGQIPHLNIPLIGMLQIIVVASEGAKTFPPSEKNVDRTTHSVFATTAVDFRPRRRWDWPMGVQPIWLRRFLDGCMLSSKSPEFSSTACPP